MYSIPILQEIQTIVPTVIGLKADLCKLNVLYACGGFCKSHIDTPHADEIVNLTLTHLM